MLFGKLFFLFAIVGASSSHHRELKANDPVFGDFKPWENVVDDLTKALICICQQVIQTKPVPNPPANDPPARNVCADEYCKKAGLNPIKFGCDAEDNLFGSAGEIERCVMDVHPEDCYINYPDLSDRAKTLAYFRAIARCLPAYRPTTTTTTAAVSTGPSLSRWASE